MLATQHLMGAETTAPEVPQTREEAVAEYKAYNNFAEELDSQMHTARDLFWKNTYELVLLAGVGACYNGKNKFVTGALATCGGIVALQHLFALVSHAKNLRNLSAVFIMVQQKRDDLKERLALSKSHTDL